MKHKRRLSHTGKIRNARDYALVFLLVATSGMPFFNGREFVFIGFTVSLFIFLYLDKQLTRNFVIIAGAMMSVELMQFMVYDKISIVTLSSTLMRIIFSYAVLRITGLSFTDKYVNILYWLAVISLVLYPLLFIPGAVNFVRDNIAIYFPSPFENTNTFYQPSPTIIVWTIHHVHSYAFRNSGAFWEPGGFSVFLLIALFFHLQKEGIRYSRKHIVFVITLLTTISTMAYIAYFVLLYFVFFKKMHLFFKIMIIPVFVLVGYVSYNSLDFIGGKIEKNITVADETTSSRFGSALADLELIEESPVIGWGRGTNRYNIDSYSAFNEEDHRNNGLTNIIVTYGIPLAIFLISLYYANFKKFSQYCNINADLTTPFFIVMLICSFSQILFMKSAMLSLLFLQDVYHKRPFKSRPQRIPLHGQPG